MHGFRKKLCAEGISEESAALITNAKWTGTYTHYELAWRKWSSWCSQRLINSFKASLPEILTFLTHFLHEGYEYNITAGYRTPVSAYHEPSNRFAISGIFNNRPTEPKFNFVWDIKNVLDFLETMNSEGLGLKELTLKLTMLLALTSAASFRNQLSRHSMFG